MARTKEPTKTKPLFDQQAASFNDRAGLPESARRQIAGAIVEMAEPRPKGLLFDVGAGTGEIGFELSHFPLRYVGFDVSPQMIAEFRKRYVSEADCPSLVIGDARQRWPLEDGSAAVIFGSRSLHWLDPDHIAAEAYRVTETERSTLIVGRVARQGADMRQMIRRELHRRLESAGLEPRRGERHAGRSLEACIRRGAAELPERVAARWNRSWTSRRLLDSWRDKRGLAGVVDISESDKAAVLHELQQWISGRVGNIDTPFESAEEYVLHGARLTR